MYFDMIARQTRVNEATEVCLEQGWKDALPLIELVIEKPSSLGASRDAYTTYRQLSGKPIDPKLLQAAKVIQQQCAWDRALLPKEEELAAARRAFVDSTDVAGAAYGAFSLAMFTTKANNIPAVQNDGIKILRALPRPEVETILTRHLNGLSDNSDRQAVQKVREQVSGTARGVD